MAARGTPLIARVRAGAIGADECVASPLGPRRILYADSTATGRPSALLEDALRARQGEISAGRNAWRAELVGSIDPASLRHHAAAGVGLFRKAQRTVLEIASLDKGIAKARAEAVEAARARRTLEILRERRLAAFNELESRREQTALDEIAANGARTAARHADAGSLA